LTDKQWSRLAPLLNEPRVERHAGGRPRKHEQRRAADAGIKTRIGNHTFRATGITAYLKNKGTLEAAQHIANHESPRTTKLYDRRQDEISLDEVEKILI
jgi:integrase